MQFNKLEFRIFRPKKAHNNPFAIDLVEETADAVAAMAFDGEAVEHSEVVATEVVATPASAVMSAATPPTTASP